MKKVFISHSHESDEQTNKVLQLAYQLTDWGGLEVVLDLWEQNPAGGWNLWMEKNIRDADYTLLVCTPSYHAKVMHDTAPGHGQGVKWEGRIIRNLLNESDSLSTRFLPVFLGEVNKAYIPTVLRDASHFRADTTEGFEQLYRLLTSQSKYKKPTPKAAMRTLDTVDVPVTGGQPLPRISFNRFPTTSGLFEGRKEELQLLDDCWADPNCHVLLFVAMGGTGKTALVNRWLDAMQSDGYRGAARVFGWSFYSQGAGEDRQTSADPFLLRGYAFLGYGEEHMPKDPWERGRKLAELFATQPTLLILDGLEPLQYPHGPDGLGGRLKDPSLESFLRYWLQRPAGPGLCLLTSRIAWPYLEGHDSARLHDLGQLDEETGIAVLQKMGVIGSNDELKATVAEYKGHALALNLLGRYLSIFEEGDVRRRDKIPGITHLPNDQRSEATRLMLSYEQMFTQPPRSRFFGLIKKKPKPGPVLQLLYILGLFNQPIPIGALKALLQKPVISYLTDVLPKLDSHEWLNLCQQLRDLRLLNQSEEGQYEELDTHPLVREHFSLALEEKHPAACRDAHQRLYDYYRQLPDKEQPDTLTEMEPLFAAVHHGVRAGRVQEVFYEVYMTRINKKGNYYLTSQLGAFAADLAVLAVFFVEPWQRPHPDLTQADQLVCLGNAGFRLRALGRNQEAVGAMEAVLEQAVQIAEQNSETYTWRQAAIAAGNLSELQEIQGHLSSALPAAEQSVAYADRSQDAFQQLNKRTALAHIHHQLGQLDKAGELYQDAERRQRERQPVYAYLYSLAGSRYNDYLLDRGQVEEVIERAQQTLRWANAHRILLDIALDQLTLGRAYGMAGDLDQATTYLQQAVAGLRQSGYIDYLPHGLLARAAHYRATGQWALAAQDLAEVYEIVERTGYRLHLVDYHLEYARCCRAGAPFRRGEAKVHIDAAAGLIEEMGYHRRDGELEELRKGG